MLPTLRSVLLTAAALATIGLAGCAAPCDRYCTSRADYIEFCLENGSADQWQDAEWSVWGAPDKDAYLTDCKDDMASQTERADADTQVGACEDEANQYTEWEERGSCVDLP